jgi:hypothetical protein
MKRNLSTLGANVFDAVISVGDAARTLGQKPHILSLLIYRGHFDQARCPMVCGRRLIERAYLPEMRKILRELGRLPASA